MEQPSMEGQGPGGSRKGIYGGEWPSRRSQQSKEGVSSKEVSKPKHGKESVRPEEKSVCAWGGLAWDVETRSGKGAFPCVAMTYYKVQPQEDEQGVYTKR